MPEAKTTTTKDLHMAASLLCCGAKMTGIDIQSEGSGDRRIGYFTFEDDGRLEELVNVYKQFKMLVEPHQLQSFVKDLKSSIASTSKKPR